MRHLYGEITDPAVRARMTVEAQANMMSHMVFLERVFNEGENMVWSRQPQGVFVHRLGDASNVADRQRYGNLAGRYISKEFSDLLTGPQEDFFKLMHNKWARRIWFAPLSGIRGATLLQVRTAVRNYYNNVTGYALASGDVALPSWKNHYARSHKILWDYMRAKPEAIQAIADAAQDGYFRASASTSMADLQILLGEGSSLPTRTFRKWMTAYQMINFPVQYAAYHARRDAGMTPEEAKDHVRRLYQSRDYTPKAVTAYSMAGGKDYTPFIVDSVRITVNEIDWAQKRLKEGDPTPLMGFILSRALWGLSKAWKPAAGFGAMWAGIHRWVRDDDRESEPLTEEEQLAYRKGLPEYDRHMPLTAWRETDRDTGKNYIYHTMWGANTPYPVEDWVIGALQTKGEGGEFMDSLFHNMKQQLVASMLVDSAVKAYTGRDIRGGYANPTGMGLQDVFAGTPDPRRNEILKEVGWQVLSDFAPGGVARPMQRIQRIQERDRSGVDPTVGMYAPSTTMDDAIWSSLRLFRTYRTEQTDFYRNLSLRIRPTSEALRKAEGMITAEALSRTVQKGSTEKQQSDARHGQLMRLQYLNEIRELFQDAGTVAPDWLTANDKRTIMRDANMNEADIYSVLTGQDLPYFHQQRVLDQMRRRPSMLRRVQ